MTDFIETDQKDAETEEAENAVAWSDGPIAEAADNTVIGNDETIAETENLATEEKSGLERPRKRKFVTRFIKRTFDIVSSGIALIILSPFFIIFTPIVAIKMRGNPFFVQKRPGKNEKIFRLIKYRTMNNARDAEGNLLPDGERLTKFGRTMRALSIDELPELFNIFLGSMSVVGPRPLLIRYLPLYNEEQKRRHVVRPGLTGLAQVSGRNAITWKQKFAKDIEYVDTYNFFLDLKIIFMTVLKVFKREGISQQGEATMEFFTGNDAEDSEEGE